MQWWFLEMEHKTRNLRLDPQPLRREMSWLKNSGKIEWNGKIRRMLLLFPNSSPTYGKTTSEDLQHDFWNSCRQCMLVSWPIRAANYRNFFPFLEFSPWQLRSTPKLFFHQREMCKMFKIFGMDRRNILCKFLLEIRSWFTIQKGMVWNLLHLTK